METLLKEWTEKFDKIYKELTPKSGSYTEKDWQDDGRITELNNCIVGLREAMAGQQQQSSANCAIFDVSKRYRFTMQDVDTNEIIIIDEDTERKAFKKAFRFFVEKKLRDRELSIVSKVDNVC